MLNYKSTTYKELNEEEINHLYVKLTNKLFIINTFWYIKIYMTFIDFDEIIGIGNSYITNNVFCVNHPTNTLITGKSNSGKGNILMNLIAQNCIYEKIYIFANNLDDKCTWLKSRFKNDAHIYINEINFSEIDKKYVNLFVFDDLVFSNKKYQHFLHKVEN